MNHKQLITAISEDTGISSKAVDLVIKSLASIILDRLSRAESIAVLNIGNFHVKFGSFGGRPSVHAKIHFCETILKKMRAISSSLPTVDTSMSTDN